MGKDNLTAEQLANARKLLAMASDAMEKGEIEFPTKALKGILGTSKEYLLEDSPIRAKARELYLTLHGMKQSKTPQESEIAELRSQISQLTGMLGQLAQTANDSADLIRHNASGVSKNKSAITEVKADLAEVRQNQQLKDGALHTLQAQISAANQPTHASFYAGVIEHVTKGFTTDYVNLSGEFKRNNKPLSSLLARTGNVDFLQGAGQLVGNVAGSAMEELSRFIPALAFFNSALSKFTSNYFTNKAQKTSEKAVSFIGERKADEVSEEFARLVTLIVSGSLVPGADDLLAKYPAAAQNDMSLAIADGLRESFKQGKLDIEASMLDDKAFKKAVKKVINDLVKHATKVAKIKKASKKEGVLKSYVLSSMMMHVLYARQRMRDVNNASVASDGETPPWSIKQDFSNLVHFICASYLRVYYPLVSKDDVPRDKYDGLYKRIESILDKHGMRPIIKERVQESVCSRASRMLQSLFVKKPNKAIRALLSEAEKRMDDAGREPLMLNTVTAFSSKNVEAMYLEQKAVLSSYADGNVATTSADSSTSTPNISTSTLNTSTESGSGGSSPKARRA